MIAQYACDACPSLDCCRHPNEFRAFKIIVLVFLEFLKNFAILLGDNERKHGIDRIATVVGGKCAHQQVIEHMSLSDIWIVLHLIEAPVCEIGGGVILVGNQYSNFVTNLDITNHSVKAIASCQCYGICKNGSRYRETWAKP